MHFKKKKNNNDNRPRCPKPKCRAPAEKIDDGSIYTGFHECTVCGNIFRVEMRKIKIDKFKFKKRSS